MLNKRSKLAKTVAIVSGFVVLGVFLVFLFGYVVMLLWNWLMPEIFGLTEVTYWQALGILLLSKLIFGFGGGGQGGNKKGRDQKPEDRKMKEKFKQWLESQEEELAGNRAEKP